MTFLVADSDFTAASKMKHLLHSAKNSLL
ncbi:hypothetical protein SIAM614_12073 [Stappia aggregata IAM 12614]|uniref:Uncharacterized protein n=1 Tax=Roseibium aggregatum (strain ATCC 25650 / DSM 13394 / JCM 20685 / NBRC 16684 / NCIMB 2208 / IAM 12614 / B1) TaxID=384765 RepID=A0NTV2_ROSAI|nr:hypothetical protein SIAM614_12073 [Stappia aggregata IAM 12614] [Roseibium aggregatum IAM 12614]